MTIREMLLRYVDDEDLPREGSTEWQEFVDQVECCITGDHVWAYHKLYEMEIERCVHCGEAR